MADTKTEQELNAEIANIEAQKIQLQLEKLTNSLIADFKDRTLEEVFTRLTNIFSRDDQLVIRAQNAYDALITEETKAEETET